VAKIHDAGHDEEHHHPGGEGHRGQHLGGRLGSALAWRSSSPVGLLRWYSKGSAWYWRTTAPLSVASIRTLATVAIPRRITMADALTRPTTRIERAPRTTVAVGTAPSSKRGMTTRSTTRPTVKEATTTDDA
jgi:hypothetical protein